MNISDADATTLESEPTIVGDEEEWYCELSADDAELTGSQFVKVTGVDETFFDENDVVPGEATLLASGAMIDGDEMMIPDGSQVEIGEVITSNSTRRRLESTGEKTFLIVRVNAGDASPNANVNQIRAKTFNGNSLLQQYEDCSHGQFTVKPYQGYGITNGVTSVDISEKVLKSDGSANENSVLRNAAVAKLNAIFDGSVKAKVDHVMLCIPPGTGGW